MIFLCCLLLVIITINFGVDFAFKQPVTDFSSVKKALAEWEENQNRRLQPSAGTLYFFDPNIVSKKQLTEWGLTDYQASNLVKYRERGGVFREADDLKKIYGLDSSQLNALIPWVRIEEQVDRPGSKAAKANPVRIELNRADSATLVKLYGIGPVFSSRIIKYRRLLGGFARKEQLLEVYNFKPEVFAQIKDRICVDTSRIEKISLNFSDYQDLVKHPYLNGHHAGKIISARNKSGPFETCEELLSKKILGEEVFRKIRPYLKLN